MCKWMIKQRCYIRCQFFKNCDVNKKNSKYSNLTEAYYLIEVLFNRDIDV